MRSSNRSGKRISKNLTEFPVIFTIFMDIVYLVTKGVNREVKCLFNTFLEQRLFVMRMPIFLFLGQ